MSFNINYHFSFSKHPRLAVLWKYQAFSKLIIPLYPILKKCAYFAAIYKRPYHSPLKIEILFSSLCPFFALSFFRIEKNYISLQPLGKCCRGMSSPNSWRSCMNFKHKPSPFWKSNAPIWSNSTDKNLCRESYYLETWAASGSTPWGRPLPLARAAKLLEATLPEKKSWAGGGHQCVFYPWDSQMPLQSQPLEQERCISEASVPHTWQGASGCRFWQLTQFEFWQFLPWILRTTQGKAAVSAATFAAKNGFCWKEVNLCLQQWLNGNLKGL